MLVLSAYHAYAVSLHMHPIGVTYYMWVIADLVNPHLMQGGRLYATGQKRKNPKRTSRTGRPLGPPR